MSRPEDVTDAMVRAALSKWFDDPPSGEVEYLHALAPAMRETIAAAINASGCVLVPRNTLKILADTACAKGAMEHAEIMALGDVADLLGAAAGQGEG